MDNASKILEIENSKNSNSVSITKLIDGEIELGFSGDWSFKEKIPSTDKLLNSINEFLPRKYLSTQII